MLQVQENSSIKIADMTAELLNSTPYEQAVSLIEGAARNCYQSKSKDTLPEKEAFIRSLIKKGHESPLEHISYTMKVLIDRGILAEWTRHRIGSAYSVESTRYVNYAKQDNMIIAPTGLTQDQWNKVLGSAAKSIWAYQSAIKEGLKPEQARALLPQCLAVHMVVTHNVRQWRHIFQQRLCNHHAHPDFRRILKLCYDILVKEAPVFFEDLEDSIVYDYPPASPDIVHQVVVTPDTATDAKD